MPSAFRRRAVAAVVALASLVGPALPAAAAGPGLSSAPTPAALAGPTDVVTFMGEGGYLAHGYMTRAFTGDHVDVRVLDQAADRLEMHLGGEPGERGLLLLSSPVDEPRLSVGRYLTTRYPGAREAGLDLSMRSHGCNESQGWIDVLEVSRDASGGLTGLAADYGVTCGHDPAPVRGSIRWNSAVPYRYTDVVHFTRSHWAGGREWGAVTLTNAGTLPQRYGRTTWPELSGPGVPADLVRIEHDGCDGTTLAPGASCQVRVSALSGEDRLVVGWFRTPDETARGAAYSLLLVPEPELPGATTLVAIPRRGGVELVAPRQWLPRYRVLRAAGDDPEVEVARNVDLPWTDTDVTLGTTYRYRVVPVFRDVDAPASNTVTTGPLPVPVGAQGTFVPVEPARIVDTRTGTGAPRARVGAGRSLRFDPAGSGHIPSDGVAAVVLNLTGTEPTERTHLRVWPAGRPRPDTSSLNLLPGQSRPNQVVVPLGRDGEVDLYNDAGSTHVVVDVQGYYSTAGGRHGGGFHVAVPWRVLDSRDQGRPLAPGEEIWVGVGAVEHGGCCRLAAVDVNLTVTGSTGAGHLTAWDGDGEAPLASNLNFVPGQTVANHAVVPTSRDSRSGSPRFRLRNSSPGTVHVIVDVQGWYDVTGAADEEDALRFAPVRTSRLVDTRLPAGRGPVAPGDSVTIPGPTLPPAMAQVVNVTGTGSPGAGHLTAWTGDGALPPTSTLNFARGEDSANLATVGAGTDGRIALTPGTSGVHVVVDHLGYFY